MLFVLVHGDDILITGKDSTAIHILIQDLNKSFALKTLGDVHCFLGFEVLRTNSALHLKQTKYATDLLTQTNMLSSKACSTPMSLANKLYQDDSSPFSQPSLYRSTIGLLSI